MPMTVGVPAETKADERRVAVTAEGVRELRAAGCTVLVERGAGEGSGVADAEYRAAGAELVGRDAAWGAELVCKVKEPQPDEFALLRADQTVFTYLHLAAYPRVAEALARAGTCAVGYETVVRHGALPLLAPMSEVAGRVAAQTAARLLEAPHGGRGVLMGGAAGVAPARVVVLGAGSAGVNAARVCLGMGAQVVAMDRDVDRLRHTEAHLGGRLVCRLSTAAAVADEVAAADAVVGAVLVPGGRAPRVVTRAMVESMRPGSVVVDLAVDQGGCVETTVETSLHDPVRTVAGVVHCAVGNFPAAVPHTSTRALCAATLPYVVALAAAGTPAALRADAGLAAGLNTWRGEVAHPEVARALGVAHVPWTAR